MTDEVTFYTNPMSRGRTVGWMLEEIGAPYRTEVLELGTTMKSAEFLALNRWQFFAAGPLEAAAVDRAVGLDLAPQMRRGWYGSRERKVSLATMVGRSSTQ